MSDDQDGKVIDEIWIIKNEPRTSYEELNQKHEDITFGNFSFWRFYDDIKIEIL